MNNILNAANYESSCDYSYLPPYGKFCPPEINTISGTIFCKTDFIDDLFYILRDCNIKHNLLTHHSDYPIDMGRWNKKPKCIEKWFAINPTIEHNDLIPIPLGIKTHKEPYFEPQYESNWFIENVENLKSIKKEKNIYCNWNITNKDRLHITEKLNKTGIEYTFDQNLPFRDYIVNMASHKFVISPSGNGIDCHRTWEALYLGCMPIVIKNKIYNRWDGVPILQVNDFSDITQEILNNFINKEFTLDKLNIEYWTKQFCENLKRS